MTGYSIHRCISPAVSLGLVSLDQVKDEIGIPINDTTKDSIIGNHITQVSAAIHTYCDRIFVRQGYRDQFRSTYSTGLASGTPLVVRQRPIVLEAGLPVMTIIEDGVQLLPEQWEVDEQLGRIYRLDGAWSGNPITVDYDGGYIIVPPDLQAAALKSVSARYHNVGRDPMLRSQTIPDVVAESYWASADAAGNRSSTTIPVEVYAVLDAYVLRFM